VRRASERWRAQAPAILAADMSVTADDEADETGTLRRSGHARARDPVTPEQGAHHQDYGRWNAGESKAWPTPRVRCQISAGWRGATRTYLRRVDSVPIGSTSVRDRRGRRYLWRWLNVRAPPGAGCSERYLVSAAVEIGATVSTSRRRPREQTSRTSSGHSQSSVS